MPRASRPKYLQYSIRRLTVYVGVGFVDSYVTEPANRSDSWYTDVQKYGFYALFYGETIRDKKQWSRC